MRTTATLERYYVLPCCLLLLNLCVELVSYKAKMIEDPYLQVGAVIAMVLFGGSLVAFVLAPSIETLVGTLRRGVQLTADTPSSRATRCRTWEGSLMLASAAPPVSNPLRIARAISATRTSEST